MLPLSLLNAAVGSPILVELKNGETYNGHLEKCDNFMNITLREVIQTDSDGVLDKAKEEMARNRNISKRGRGSGHHQRGGGRGGRGRYNNNSANSANSANRGNN